MRLLRFRPHPILSPYVETVWLFESTSGLPAGDVRTIVPNGRIKLIIPFRSDQFIAVGDKVALHRQESITVTGMMDGPVVVHTAAENIGILGVEFKTAAAFHFLGLPLKELTDTIVDIGDVLGRPGTELQERIADVAVPEKIRQVEHLLVSRLCNSPGVETLVSRAVGAISASDGRIRIEDLCSEIGLSRRYLDMKFADQVGISPKALARIVRFQRIYKLLSQGQTLGAPQAVDDDYYDQAHLIKEFKQFTGYSPGLFSRQSNDFGGIFYRD